MDSRAHQLGSSLAKSLACVDDSDDEWEAAVVYKVSGSFLFQIPRQCGSVDYGIIVAFHIN